MSRGAGITRQAILAALKRQDARTADDLAEALGISPVAVRQHLATLEREKMVAITIARRGLGRPQHRYHLTPQGDETFPRQYAPLALELLAQICEWNGPEGLQQILALRREEKKRRWRPALENGTFAGKLQELARLETEDGYMAEAHPAGADAYALVKRNCAVCAVARHFPEVCCAGEAGFYQEMLRDATVVQTRSILDGDGVCAFHIEPRSGDKAAEGTEPNPSFASGQGD